jgi:hypothetical protein
MAREVQVLGVEHRRGAEQALSTADFRLSTISRAGTEPKAAKAFSLQARKNSISGDTVNSRYMRRL